VPLFHDLHSQQPRRSREDERVNEGQRKPGNVFERSLRFGRQGINLPKAEALERFVELVKPPDVFDGNDLPLVDKIVERGAGKWRREEAADDFPLYPEFRGEWSGRIGARGGAFHDPEIST